MEVLTRVCPETSSSCVDVHGLRIGVRSNVAGALEQLGAHLPAGWTSSPSERIDRWYGLYQDRAGTQHVLEVGGRRLAQSERLGELWQHFEYEVELDVAEHSPKYVFVHAGVVGWRRQAIVLPGRSGSGKSSLVAALCQAGAEYYSDEFALFDRQGRVHPYPRPLRLRQAIPNVAVPADLGCAPACGQEPLQVGQVVLAHHECGATWEPTPVSPSEATLELLQHAMSVQRQPRVVLQAITQALASACSLRGARGEAMETAESLIRRAA